MKPLLVDAHEDLAWNMLCFGRDYTRSAEETRRLERETDSIAPQVNGDTLLGWPDYQRGRVAVVFATLFAAPERHRLGAWDIQSYADFDQAHRLYRVQLDAYHRLVDRAPDRFRLIQTSSDLQTVLDHWKHEEKDHPVGLVVLMEGAEGVRAPEELELWWEGGVRLIGPAWTGTRYCGGTGEPGPLTRDGYALLEAMSDFGFALDLSHMDAQAALQALDAYPGVVVATHANPKALLPGRDSNRFLPDEVIRGLIERDGVIGVVPYNRFLVDDWTRSDGREVVSIERVGAHIDYICQMAGDARHVGIGTDFDGGFGWQAVPREIHTIADLQLLAPWLADHGYSDEDIHAIFGGNWLGRLERSLPEGA